VLLDARAQHRRRNGLERPESPLLLHQRRHADPEEHAAERAHDEQHRAGVAQIALVLRRPDAGAKRRARRELEELADEIHDRTLGHVPTRVVRRPRDASLVRERQRDAVRGTVVARRRFLERDVGDVAQRDRLALDAPEALGRDDDHAVGLAERERLARGEEEHCQSAERDERSDDRRHHGEARAGLAGETDPHDDRAEQRDRYAG